MQSSRTGSTYIVVPKLTRNTIMPRDRNWKMHTHEMVVGIEQDDDLEISGMEIIRPMKGNSTASACNTSFESHTGSTNNAKTIVITQPTREGRIAEKSFHGFFFGRVNDTR